LTATESRAGLTGRRSPTRVASLDRHRQRRSRRARAERRHPRRRAASDARVPFDACHRRGDHYDVDGELSIGGITHAITLAVELGGVEEFPGGPRHAGFEAVAQLRRKDYDIDVALPPGVSSVALGDVVKIEIDPQLLEPETAG
jgi:hypothetical protein